MAYIHKTNSMCQITEKVSKPGAHYLAHLHNNYVTHHLNLMMKLSRYKRKYAHKKAQIRLLFPLLWWFLYNVFLGANLLWFAHHLIQVDAAKYRNMPHFWCEYTANDKNKNNEQALEWNTNARDCMPVFNLANRVMINDLFYGKHEKATEQHIREWKIFISSTDWW